MNYMQQQQSPYEWLKWIPVAPHAQEKHVGIAVIRFERRFIFRFKILPSEHGGYWATTASLKTGVVNGKDKYDNAFSMDSDYENEAMKEFVIQKVEEILSQQRVNPNAQASAFGVAQGHSQPNPNYGQYPQQQYNAPQTQQNWPQAQNFGASTQGQAQQKPSSMDETIPF